MISKKILVPVFAFFVLLSGVLFVVPPAHAQGTNSGNGNFFSGLVQFIAQKFGLDKTQVQSAINDYHTQNKANIALRPTPSAQDLQNRDKTRLDKLVSAGKITAAQEQAILDELTSLRLKYKFDKSLTTDQRKTQMQAMQADIKSWATSQGINPSYVMMFGISGLRGRGMREPGEGWGEKPSVTPTQTPTPTQ
jgi:polyhydroxyalkanoate synthesis regulator phasin